MSKVIERNKSLLSSVSLMQHALTFSIFIAIVTFQTIRLQPAQPTLLQDEYVYSVGTKYGGAAEAARFGNFLYFELYKTTQYCGADFYTCARNINAFWFVFLLVALFVFALRFFSWLPSTAIVSGVGLGSLGLYSSLYMPEMMYFALSTAGLVFFLFYLERLRGNYWIPIGAAFTILALASLVKPHATFLALGMLSYLVLFETIESLRGRGANRFGSYLWAIVTFLITKFSLGWLLAGSAGLTIFGNSYTNALVDFFGDLFQPTQAEGSGTVGGRGSANAETLYNEGLLANIDVFFSHFGVSLLVAIILAGPLLASLVVERSSLRIGIGSAVLYLYIFMAVIVSLFAAHLTGNGDNHSDRLLLRYFEFLLPLIFIIGLSAATKGVTKGARRYIALGISLLSIVVAFTALQDRTWIIADSAHLFGLFENPDGSWFWAVVLSTLTYFVFINLSFRQLSLWIVFAVGIAGLGQIAIQQQLKLNGFMIASDYAGQYVYENYPSLDGDRIVVLGSDRKLVEAAMFRIDKPNIEFRLFQSGSFLDPNSVPDQFHLVVQTTGVFLDGDPDNTYQGEGFAITEFR